MTKVFRPVVCCQCEKRKKGHGRRWCAAQRTAGGGEETELTQNAASIEAEFSSRMFVIRQKGVVSWIPDDKRGLPDE
jgi:hypothetical protein